MKKFDYSHLVLSAKEMQESLVGQHINRIHKISDYDFYFALSQKNQGLFISLNNGNPFISLYKSKLTLAKNKKESHLSTILNHHIEKSCISHVRLIEGQKIIVIELEKHYENLEIKKYYLSIELVTAHPNLLVLDDNHMIISLYKASKDFSSSRVLRISQPYHFPEIKTPFDSQSVESYDFVKHYLNEFAATLKRHNHPKLFQKVSGALKRIESKKEKIIAELSSLPDSEQVNLYGQLLLTHQPKITSKLVILDAIEIPVDEDKNWLENAQKHFNYAKKIKVTLKTKKEQLTLINEELDYYTRLKQRLEFSSDEDLVALELELNIHKISQSRSKDVASYKPYYIIHDQTKIAFGKNNIQNDYLTFNLASKKDTFIHIKDYAGAHIVLFGPISAQSLEIAALIGLYLSKKESAEFTYTTCKNVKKGHYPGQVILLDFKSFYIKSNHSLAENLLLDAKRF